VNATDFGGKGRVHSTASARGGKKIQNFKQQIPIKTAIPCYLPFIFFTDTFQPAERPIYERLHFL
jgi:hypothetical protein